MLPAFTDLAPGPAAFGTSGGFFVLAFEYVERCKASSGLFTYDRRAPTGC